jgi:hypothetical protein
MTRRRTFVAALTSAVPVLAAPGRLVARSASRALNFWETTG